MPRIAPPWRGLALLVVSGLLLGGCARQPGAQGITARQTATTALASTPPATVAPPPKPAVPAPAVPFRPLDLLSLRQRVPVLTYHDVIGSRSQKDAVWFDCTAAEFEAQMKFLHDHGAHVITLEQLRQHLTSGAPLPDHAIALTFDDSYTGVSTYAAPVLRRYNYPYAVFVHTDYVGVQKGRPKMSWAQLQALETGGLVTIGSHSRSHPADMGTLTQAQQDEELQGSRAVLERQLGRPVAFVSYPNGKADPRTFGRAQVAGYALGFLEEWGPVEQSPSILGLNRYIHIQLPRAWAETYGPDPLPEGRVLPLKAAALHTRVTRAAGVPLSLSTGGTLAARPAAQAVTAADYVPAAGAQELPLWLTSHAAGGAPEGPYQTQGGAYTPDAAPEAATPDTASLSTTTPDAAAVDLTGRPLVAWNGTRLALLPYAHLLMDQAAPLQRLLPELQGTLLAPAWLVQGGVPLSRARIAETGTPDLRTLRRRVFLGVTAEGVPLLGVSQGVVSARQLALAAAAVGATDAVLLY